MSRLKTLSVLGGTIAVLALSASPAAYAEWVSNNGSTRGIVTITASGSFFYPPANTVKCPASEIKAQWIIQGAGQIKQQLKSTTRGPNLLIQVKNWGANCEAEIGTIGLVKPVKITECTFRATQQLGSTEPTGGASTGCLVVVGSVLCEIQVPAGMEGPQGSGKGINVGLKKIVVTKEGNNTKGKINANEGGQGQLTGEGIFAQSVGTNALCPLAHSTEEATLTGVEGTLEGVTVE